MITDPYVSSVRRVCLLLAGLLFAGPAFAANPTPSPSRSTSETDVTPKPDPSLERLRPQFKALTQALVLKATAPPPTALSAFQGILDDWPDFYPPVIHLVEVAAASADTLDATRRAFLTRVQRTPTDARAWFGLMRVELKRGDWTAALKAGQEAIRLHCPYWGCYSDVGRAFAQLGRAAEGAQYLEALSEAKGGAELQGLAFLALYRLGVSGPSGKSPAASLEQAVLRLKPGRGQETALYFQALWFSSQGNVPLAGAAFEQALHIYHQVGDEAQEGSLLIDFSEFLITHGLAQKAVTVLRAALPLYRRSQDLSQQALILQNIGTLENQAGRLEEALEAYAEAEKLWATLRVPRRQMECLVGVADTLGSLGRLVEAQTRLDQLLALSREQKDGMLEGFALHHQGRILNAMGRPGEALKVYRQALEIRRAQGSQAEVGMTLQNLADTYRRLGEVTMGRALLEEALTLHRQNPGQNNSQFWIGLTLGNLGDAWLETGDVGRALEHYQQALEVHRAMSDARWEGIVEVKLAAAALREPDPSGEGLHRAEEGLDRALSLLRRSGDQVEEATALRVLGELRLKQGRNSDGVQALEQAAQQYETLGEGWLAGAAQKSLARAYARMGDRAQALTTLEAGIEAQRKVQQDLRDPSLQAAYFSSFAGDYAFAIRLLTTDADGRMSPTVSETVLAQTFELAEQARASSFHHWLQLAQVDLTLGASPEALQRVRQLEAALSSIREQEHTAGQSRSERDRLEQRFQARSRELREAQAAVYDQAPELRRLREQPLATLSQVQQALSSDTLLVAYLLDSEGSFAWLITHNEARLAALPSERGLADEIDSLLRTAADSQSPLAGLERSATLTYARLFPQGQDLLKTHPRLVIVPDGGLGRLPFEMLVERPRTSAHEKPAWLGLSHALSYAPSVSAWYGTSASGLRVPLEGALLAIGDPIYHTDTCTASEQQVATRGGGSRAALWDESWSRLCASREEIRQIQRSRQPGWGGSSRARSPDVYLLGADATERRLKGEGPARFSLLHFATHGQTFQDDPGRSALILGQNVEPPSGASEGPRDAGDDGYLDLNDILGLKLRAELVVLSACETATGRARKGEGVESLARGLLVAGARRVIASQWPVDDLATAGFMGALYQEMRRYPLDVALQRVRAQFIRGHAHPYYWAPFILTAGGGERLREPGQTP